MLLHADWVRDVGVLSVYFLLKVVYCIVIDIPTVDVVLQTDPPSQQDQEMVGVEGPWRMAALLLKVVLCSTFIELGVQAVLVEKVTSHIPLPPPSLPNRLCCVRHFDYFV